MSTLPVESVSLPVEDFEELHQQRKWLVKELNRERLNKFNNGEPIFEYTVEDLPARTGTPDSDMMALTHSNALDAWTPALWKAIREGTLSPISENDKLATNNLDEASSLPLNRKQVILSGPTYNEGTVAVGDIVIDVPHSEQNQQEIQQTDVIYLNYGNELEVEIPTKDSYTSTFQGLPYSEDVQLAFTLMVATGALDMAQIEAPTDSQLFPETFDHLEVEYAQVKKRNDLHVYLVASDHHSYAKIEAYLDSPNVGVQEYTEMLGFPKEVANYFTDGLSDKYARKYDRYSSEEIALNLFMKEEFDVSDLHAFALCPYRVPPTEKQARYAVQLGHQIRQGLNQAREIQTLDVASTIDRYERTMMNGTRPVFPFYEWPVLPDD